MPSRSGNQVASRRRIRPPRGLSSRSGYSRVPAGMPRSTQEYPVRNRPPVLVVRAASAAAADQGEAEREEAGDRREVEEDGGGVSGGEVVPGAAPREDLLEGDVGEVVGGAVGVAGRVVVGEGVVVDRLGVGDLVGADHARVADVDDAGVGEVAGQPQRDQADHGDGHQPDRHRRAQPLPRPAVAAVAAEADPEHADEQVGERRVVERHRDADLGGVEEGLADPEAEQDEQIEVDPLTPAAEVPEAEQEDQGERDPDVGRVEDVAELAALAARHRPVDGRPRPGLGRDAGLAVDDDQVDLLVVEVVADLPDVDGLGAQRCGQPIGGGQLGLAGEDLRILIGDPERLLGADLVVGGLVGEAARHRGRAAETRAGRPPIR